MVAGGLIPLRGYDDAALQAGAVLAATVPVYFSEPGTFNCQ